VYCLAVCVVSFRYTPRHLMNLSAAQWKRVPRAEACSHGGYSCCTATDNGACFAPAVLLRGSWRAPKGDVKLLKGGPVRRPSPPAGRGYLANVRQEAPCRFSGYSYDDCVLGDPRTLGLGSFGLQNPPGILCLEKLSRCLQQTTRS